MASKITGSFRWPMTNNRSYWPTKGQQCGKCKHVMESSSTYVLLSCRYLLWMHADKKRQWDSRRENSHVPHNHQCFSSQLNHHSTNFNFQKVHEAITVLFPVLNQTWSSNFLTCSINNNRRTFTPPPENQHVTIGTRHILGPGFYQLFRQCSQGHASGPQPVSVLHEGLVYNTSYEL